MLLLLCLYVEKGREKAALRFNLLEVVLIKVTLTVWGSVSLNFCKGRLKLLLLLIGVL